MDRRHRDVFTEAGISDASGQMDLEQDSAAVQRTIPISSKDAFGRWEIKSTIRLMEMGRLPKTPVRSHTLPDAKNDSDRESDGGGPSFEAQPEGAPAPAGTQATPEAVISDDTDALDGEWREFSEHLKETNMPDATDGRLEATDDSPYRIDADAIAERALTQAAKELEPKLASLSQQLNAANAELEQRRAELAAMDTANANEIAKLQNAHAHAIEDRVAEELSQAAQIFDERLATERSRWDAEVAERIAAVQRSADASLEAQLAEARDRWQAESEAALAEARLNWDGDASERLAGETRELELENAQLRKQLGAAKADIMRVREQALADAQSDKAREIAALCHTHERHLEEQISAAKQELEQDYQERLADALREAKGAADADLQAAKDSWQAGEAVRIAAAQRGLETELAELRQKLAEASDDAGQQAIAETEAAHADEIAALKRHAEGLEAQLAQKTDTLEQQLADRLASARAQWQTDADELVAQARAKAEEEAKKELAEARHAWEAEAVARFAKSQQAWRGEQTQQPAATARGRQSKLPAKTKAARQRARFGVRPRRWLPRRSLVVKVAALGVIVFLISQPEVKSRIPLAKAFVVEQSAIAAVELRTRFDALVEKLRESEMLRESLPTWLDNAGADRPNRTTIEVARANLRAGPSTAAAVIGSLGRGNEVVLLDRQDGWHLVRFGEGSDAQSGWVSSRLLGN